MWQTFSFKSSQSYAQEFEILLKLQWCDENVSWTLKFSVKIVFLEGLVLSEEEKKKKLLLVRLLL